jgi:hypothetical protein
VIWRNLARQGRDSFVSVTPRTRGAPSDQTAEEGRMNRGSIRVRVLAIIVSLMIASSSFAAPRGYEGTTWGRFERIVEKILKKVQKSFRLETHDDAAVPPKP